MNQRRVFNRAAPIALALSLILVGPALARSPQSDDAWNLIASMPADARLVVVADDLSANLSSPAGRSLQRAIADSGFFRPTFRQWTELAQRLDLGPREAIDALLGRRVVFVGRALSPPRVGEARKDNAWALMMWIPAEIEQRVRKGLELTPRAKVAGQPVLAAEHGDFSLAMLATRADSGDDQTILLLAPAVDDSMLRPIIDALVTHAAARQPPKPTGAAPGRPQAQPGAFLHVAARTPGPGALSLSVRPTDLGWQADLRIEKPGDQRGAIGARPVSVARFDALAPDALALVMESAPDRFDAATDAGMTIGALFPEVPERFLRLMGGRNLLMIERADPVATGLRLSLASEATYPGDPVAEGDRAIGALLSPGPGSVLPEGAIEGQYPLAARTAPLEIADSSLFGARTRAAWAYSPPHPDATRWWALRLAPAQPRETSDVRAFVNALARQPQEQTLGRTIALGLVRPHALRQAIGEAPWMALPPVEAISRIDRLSWSLTLEPPRVSPGSHAPTVLTGRAKLDMRLDDASQLGAPSPDPKEPGPRSSLP